MSVIKEFDETIETGGFELIVIFLASLPLWQLAALYFYTFFLGKKGKEYRGKIKYIKFPYYLRYKLFMKRLKRLFGEQK